MIDTPVQAAHRIPCNNMKLWHDKRPSLFDVLARFIWFTMGGILWISWRFWSRSSDPIPVHRVCKPCNSPASCLESKRAISAVLLRKASSGNWLYSYDLSFNVHVVTEVTSERPNRLGLFLEDKTPHIDFLVPVSTAKISFSSTLLSYPTMGALPLEKS
jgi:hypothetical protein